MGVLAPGIGLTITGEGNANPIGTPAAPNPQQVGGADATGAARRLMTDAFGDLVISDSSGVLTEYQVLVLAELRTISRLIHMGMSIPDDLDAVRADVLSTITSI